MNRWICLICIWLPLSLCAQKPGRVKAGTKTSTLLGGLSSSTLLFQSGTSGINELKFKSDYMLGYEFNYYAGRLMSFGFGLGLQNSGAVTHYYTQRINYDLTYVYGSFGPNFHIPLGASSLTFGGAAYGQYLAAATQEGGNLYIDLLRENYLLNYDFGFVLNCGLRLRAGFKNALIIRGEYRQGLNDIEIDRTQQLYNLAFNVQVGYQIIF